MLLKKLKRYGRQRYASLLRRPLTHRRYIDGKAGMTAFLDTLKAKRVDYVVLRWFDTLPDISPGEDVDILVADEDAARIVDCVSVNRRSQDIACDIYSVSGLPGTSHRDGSYYPPDKARQMLEHAVWMNGLVRVPSVDEHFLSLSYHAIYHKGYLSGIPSEHRMRNTKVVVPQDHDYRGILENLHGQSSHASTALDMTLERLDAFLSGLGWRPDPDTLKRLSKRNEWIGEHFFG
ncbi:hypothetical protein EKK97_00990 [Billgrantia tianxiuensis]|jgi:hypothetical protein|uniref:Uncharacterized protein n=1 Tax=Billgrantia tianxiuensis TaxID=2497861 RepID=A0A6I6SII2_9GAMM|nr:MULTISPECIES: hypothetical protein [Halomonas]MCE8035042.1 hypothetical protein [Halomonas sp. MCCC 1A11057]QHC48456.1 hypothetical protein EKK97_00990 [Halomonas tianxiuensis]